MSVRVMAWMLSLSLSGCATTTAPPSVELPQAPVVWQTPWQPAKPGDGMDKGAWWTLFKDEQLNQLEQQALTASPTLQAAVARLRQAHDLAEITGGARLPRVDAGFKDTRTRSRTATLQNDLVLNSTVSYEVDLFGRLRYDQQAAQAFEQQAQTELLNARLVLSADLAAFYFNVRSLDAEIVVVQKGLQSQIRAGQVLNARHEGGVISNLDVAQQQAQLDATRTQLTLLQKQRAQLEHALATLTGTAASQFKLGEAPLPTWVPRVPVALPSDVLQRRPDIAASERAVAAANAQIGLASAAWFPSITLSASGGWEARDIARLIDAPSLLWAIGGALTQTVFDGGRTHAREDQARAGHELALANYRQSVLRALQEVEDGLSSLNALDTAQVQSQAAVQSAQKVLDIAQDRYAGGLSTYLDVVTAQQNVLNNERLSSQLRGQQLQSTTYLIKALGGGWQP